MTYAMIRKPMIRSYRCLLKIWKIIFGCSMWLSSRSRMNKGKLTTCSWMLSIFIWTLLVIYCLIIYYCDKQRYGYTVPNKCVATSCQVLPPLDKSQLSHNLLLILIHASAMETKRRKAIRSTWIKDIINGGGTSPIQYRFVLGGSGLSKGTLQLLQEESNKYQDIIILPTVTDSHATLTQRTLYGFKYAYKNYRFDFILKCDDDTFVDVLRVASKLQKIRTKGRLYWGTFRGEGKILSFGKYSETKWSVCNTYFPYAFGGGYILSRDLIQLLVQNEPYLMQYKNEDVSVGAWLSPYNIERTHDVRFNTAGFSKGCKHPYVVSHKVSPKTMYYLQSTLTTEGTFCSHKTYFHCYHGYLYNWTAPASQCCRYNDDVP